MDIRVAALVVGGMVYEQSDDTCLSAAWGTGHDVTGTTGIGGHAVLTAAQGGTDRTAALANWQRGKCGNAQLLPLSPLELACPLKPMGSQPTAQANEAQQQYRSECSRPSTIVRLGSGAEITSAGVARPPPSGPRCPRAGRAPWSRWRRGRAGAAACAHRHLRAGAASRRYAGACAR